MDILIKNMELPKKINNPIMISIRSDGSIQKIDTLNECFVNVESTAIEISPHGRLIEAYFDYAEFKKRYKDAFGDNFDLYNAFSIFNDMIVNAPTVLEASDGSDN